MAFIGRRGACLWPARALRIRYEELLKKPGHFATDDDVECERAFGLFKRTNRNRYRHGNKAHTDVPVAKQMTWSMICAAMKWTKKILSS